jgi:hypothetical protein
MYTEVVPGQLGPEAMMPVSDRWSYRPYVYSDSWSVISNEMKRIPGLADSFGGLTDGMDRTYQPEQDETETETETQALPAGALEGA